MNKTMSLALGALILAGSIFYFSNSNNEKENKVLVENTKMEASSRKVVEKQENTNKTETSKIEVKKEDNNSRGPVIYKNTPENEGYNMELEVPAKWAHLDYSRLGQPEEVALKPEEYMAGDKIYSKDDPRYYKDGKKYLSVGVEEILLKLVNDRENISVIERVLNNPPEELIGMYEEEYKNDFVNSFSDINNLIYIDKETGRKKIKEYSGKDKKKNSFIDYIYRVTQFVCSYDGLCPDPDAKIDPFEGDNELKKPEDRINYSKIEVENLINSREYSKDEYVAIRRFLYKGSGVIATEYNNFNISKEMKNDEVDKDEYCLYHKFYSFCKN